MCLGILLCRAWHMLKLCQPEYLGCEARCLLLF